jgi:hypothetical protein
MDMGTGERIGWVGTVFVRGIRTMLIYNVPSSVSGVTFVGMQVGIKSKPPPRKTRPSAGFFFCREMNRHDTFLSLPSRAASRPRPRLPEPQ